MWFVAVVLLVAAGTALFWYPRDPTAAIDNAKADQEVKKSKVGRGTKASHLTYLGDATIGENTNIGAGTITCNYDGVRKNETHIGDNVKIGSDTMLVAPVTIGDGAATGAGSVVTKDVPPRTIAAGVPARAIREIAYDESPAAAMAAVREARSPEV